MYGKMQQHLAKELAAIEEAGLYKREREIITCQGAEIKVSSGADVLNFCANNYLGLSDNPTVIEAAKQMMDRRGYLWYAGYSSRTRACRSLLFWA